MWFLRNMEFTDVRHNSHFLYPKKSILSHVSKSFNDHHGHQKKTSLSDDNFVQKIVIPEVLLLTARTCVSAGDDVYEEFLRGCCVAICGQLDCHTVTTGRHNCSVSVGEWSIQRQQAGHS